MFWHIENFEKYIREDINPYGLRIQIFPLIDNISQYQSISEFKKRWEDNLQLCTRNMMKMLIEEYKVRTLSLEKDIDLIYSKLQTFKSLPAFKEHKERIKTHLDQATAEFLGKKENKFWRDKMSFQEGKAYRWQRNNHTLGVRTKGLTKSTAERASDSSINSSVSSFS